MPDEVAGISVTHWLELYGPMGIGWVISLYFGIRNQILQNQKDRLQEKYHQMVVTTNTLQQKTIDTIIVLKQMSFGTGQPVVDFHDAQTRISE